MKLNVLAFKDKALGCFTNPFYTDVPQENIIVAQTRMITQSTADKRVAFVHKALYKLGEFEDTTGILIPCEAELLLDCDDVMAQHPVIEKIVPVVQVPEKEEEDGKGRN